MKCARHPEHDAIGICLACARGVCVECAVDLDRALACRDRCEPEVRRLLDLRDFSFAQPSTQEAILHRSKHAYRRSGLFFLLLGTMFAGWSYFYMLDNLMLMMGCFFAGYGLWQLLGTRHTEPSSQFRLCSNCGYNITGNTMGKCPECGHFI